MNKLIFFLLILLMPLSGKPCDCNPDHFIGMKEAKEVFEGTVESIRKVTAPIYRYEVTFIITRWIKGTLTSAKAVVNLTSLNEAGCGFEFDFYSSYQVYTYEKNGLLYTGFCTGTHKLE